MELAAKCPTTTEVSHVSSAAITSANPSTVDEPMRPGRRRGRHAHHQDGRAQHAGHQEGAGSAVVTEEVHAGIMVPVPSLGKGLDDRRVARARMLWPRPWISARSPTTSTRASRPIVGSAGAIRAW